MKVEAKGEGVATGKVLHVGAVAGDRTQAMRVEDR